MEMDPRQGDLFLTLLQGGKKDEYPDYKKKFDETFPPKSEKEPLPSPDGS